MPSGANSTVADGSQPGALPLAAGEGGGCSPSGSATALPASEEMPPAEEVFATKNLASEKLERSLDRAAQAIRSADALIVFTGAGMGVDSGLGTYRGANAGSGVGQ